MEEVNWDWSIIRTCLERHLVTRHPRSQSTLPQSVVVYFLLISHAVVSDSVCELDAMIISSTLIADIEKPECVDRV